MTDDKWADKMTGFRGANWTKIRQNPPKNQKRILRRFLGDFRAVNFGWGKDTVLIL
ncbi:hypothetical protein [Moraxella equi]|uniref:hypothetical protein n=1 Tax=Moraxella equi TaxID=60442 RepID=UPI001301FC63|nr:hypothetical protein [Moraxella equi]